MYKIIGANQTQYGPVSAAQLRQWIAEGRADASTQTQAEGSAEWKALGQLPEFADCFAPPSAAGPPTIGPTPPDESGRILAAQQASGPAVGLMVTGGLTVFLSVLGILATVLGFSLAGMRGMSNGVPPGMQMMQFYGGVIGVVIRCASILAGLAIIYGGVKMKKLESHGLCLAASILAMIPLLSCCCVGLPIGIWALIVLNKPEVRDYFD